MPFRDPTADEARLLRWLAARAGAPGLPARWLEGLQVEEMADGGMGSLRLIPPGSDSGRRHGSSVAELQFTDADGVEVIATLNTDPQGQPLELDVWKTDFTPLLRIPQDLPEGAGGDPHRVPEEG